MNNPIQPIDTKELSKKEKRKIYHKKYHEANKEKLKSYHKTYYEANKNNVLAKQRDYKITNKGKIKAYTESWQEANRDKLQDWLQANKEKNKAYAKQWRDANKGYHKKRGDADPLYKMKCYLRAHSGRAFKRIGANKPIKTEHLLGCSWEEAKRHFESLFTEGMSWDNHGKWHIDHIIPIATATTIEEAKALNHISNLQPLWAEDNLSKRKRY